MKSRGGRSDGHKDISFLPSLPSVSPTFLEKGSASVPGALRTAAAASGLPAPRASSPVRAGPEPTCQLGLGARQAPGAWWWGVLLGLTGEAELVKVEDEVFSPRAEEKNLRKQMQWSPCI